VSFASSIPASQALRTQSQSQPEPEDAPEEDAELASGTAALRLAAAPEQAVTVPRLAEFRTALGREMTGRLFEDESAAFEAVVQAVNARVVANGGPAFGRQEATAALMRLNESNDIM
jgi:hypothetical protein